MNISGAWEWDRMIDASGKRDRRSSCFAKVVGHRRFRKLSDHERAVNRPRPGCETVRER